MTLERLVFLSLVSLLALTGCGGGDAPETEMVTAADGETQVETGGRYAEAMIDPLGDGEVNGMAIFSDDGSEISLQLDLYKAPAGSLAAHIHEFGDCSAPDGSSAGGHWNPEGMDHGKWGDAPFHLGDLGNIEVDESGFGSITMTTDRWSLGTGEANDIAGHAIIVHEAADDFTTQPTGAAGGRIACGVIVAK
jgi:Cu-Zn family superoxide dismutase